MIFHHIGVFVGSLKDGREVINKLISIKEFTKPVDDQILKVSIQFCVDASGIRYELVAPFGENNPVSGILKSGKNILNHIAYTVTDIDKEIIRLRKNGSLPLGDPKPALAFGGNRVAFLLTPLRFIIELIEDK
jgi:methylmalonyl-CoA/ethylmalonyl-CoA epimerase